MAKLERVVGTDGFHFMAPFEAFGGLPERAVTMLHEYGTAFQIDLVEPRELKDE